MRFVYGKGDVKMNVCSNDTNIKQVYEMFDIINETLFENGLSRPEINITILPKGLHRLSPSRYIPAAWKGLNSFCCAEIIIDTSIVTAHNEQAVFTEILKCAVIHYCEENAIKCRTRNCSYLNNNFLEVATAHGLLCGKNKAYGCIVLGLDERGEMVYKKRDYLFTTSRAYKMTYNDGESCGNSHSIKYLCPICGDSVRATKKVSIGCLKCNVALIESGET